MNSSIAGRSRSVDVVWQNSKVTREDRADVLGSTGATYWLTGLSGAGKSTIALAVERSLIESGKPAYVLDGDNLRHGLNGDLGFSDEDRTENVRRIAEVASLMADAGLVVIVSSVSPLKAQRTNAKWIHETANVAFHEVFIKTSTEECARRDPKGLYAKSAAGELKGLTGIDSPYEIPPSAELVIETEGVSPESSASNLFAYIALTLQ